MGLKNNWRVLLKIAITLVIIIVFFFGFLAGYLYGDKSCIEDPLKYSIEKLNEVNNDEFYCKCNSISGKTEQFSFDKEGVRDDFLENFEDPLKWVQE